MNPVVAQAKSNPYYGRNHLGQVRCKLCDTVHRDEANFIVHLEAKKHQANLRGLQRAKQKLLEEEEERAKLKQLESQAKHEEAREKLKLNNDSATATVALKSGVVQQRSKAPRIGKPTVNYKTESQPELHQTKIWFDLSYPHVDEDSRPLHRWMSSREQNAEPINDAVKYLVFACDPYETVAFQFPNLPHTDKDNGIGSTFHSQWDPVQKVYHLYFVLG